MKVLRSRAVVDPLLEWLAGCSIGLPFSPAGAAQRWTILSGSLRLSPLPRPRCAPRHTQCPVTRASPRYRLRDRRRNHVTAVPAPPFGKASKSSSTTCVFLRRCARAQGSVFTVKPGKWLLVGASGLASPRSSICAPPLWPVQGNSRRWPHSRRAACLAPPNIALVSPRRFPVPRRCVRTLRSQARRTSKVGPRPPPAISSNTSRRLECSSEQADEISPAASGGASLRAFSPGADPAARRGHQRAPFQSEAKGCNHAAALAESGQ
jgi:hypothetical protein